MSADLLFVLSVLGATVTGALVFTVVIGIYAPWIMRGHK